MVNVARIQSQLRASASLNYESIPVPPFTCFINPDQPTTWNNYAIPDGSIHGDVDSALIQLKMVFAKNERVPRFEYLADYAPDLAAILEQHGYQLEVPTELLICTQNTQKPANPVSGLSIEELAGPNALVDIQTMVTVQRRSFGSNDADEATVEEADAFHKRFSANQFFLARLNGVPVGCGTLQLPYEGVVEIAGIATLPTYRRKGIASALTAHLTQQAFEQGIKEVFLTAADANAGRVYQRVGFQPAGQAIAYILQTPV